MKKLRFLMCIVICLVVLCGTVSAATINNAPYLGYEFNYDNESVPAPVGYEVKEIAYDYNLNLNLDFGVAGDLIYDGTDSEKPFALIRTNKYLLRADIDYNVISYYPIPSIASDKDVVLNTVNGYVFVVRNGQLDIYNTNGNFVKTVNSSTLGFAFSPTKIVHGGDTFESLFYVLSGNSIVVLDGEGNFVETKPLNVNAVDIYYSTYAASLYVLSSNSVIDLTNEIVYDINFNMSGATEFVADMSGEVFYVLISGSVYKVIGSENKAELFQNSKNVVDIEYNIDKDKLNLLYSSNTLNIVTYDGDEFLTSLDSYQILFKNPSDMLYAEDGFMYILDGGNGRILKTDKDCKIVYDIYESFIHNNEKLSFLDASGIWVRENTVFIADKENERVIVSDFKGNVKKVIVKPESLEGLEYPFRASKVLTDRNGRIYVIAESVNLGAFVFSKDYEYETFFGSNNVLTTSEAIYNYIVKKFLNKSQKQKMESNTPVTLGNFDIDKNGFIYAVTTTSQMFRNANFTNLIRKINFLDSDILGDSESKPKFGDLEWDREKFITNTSFTDIDISNDGWIVGLDGTRGKIFQYSSEGQYITSFGGLGEQYGFMNSPVAIENVGSYIYVLDDHNKCIYVYQPTQYVASLHDAFLNQDKADLESAVSNWNEVLSYNSNNAYAYYGLGIAYENAGEYKLAMENYKLANAQAQYSKAYKEYRKVYVKENFIWIVLIIAVIAALCIVTVKVLSKKFIVPETEAYSPIECKWGMPIYVLLHPADGFAQFRGRNINSTLISILIAVSFFFINILQYFKTGFIFNNNSAVNYNLLSTVFSTIVIYLLFVFSNLAIASFLDGKGNLKQIMALTSYSMVPFLLSSLINVGLSNILAVDEGIFITIVSAVGILWSLLLLIMGSIQLHEYSFGKTIFTLLLTVVAMIIFMVLGVLLFTLIQQMLTFISSVYYELSLR